MTCYPDKHLVVCDGPDNTSKEFGFDFISDSRQPEGSQVNMFKEVGAAIVQTALEGYNACVLAYGYTGSGKTYTMLGGGTAFVANIAGEAAGLVPRCISALHHKMTERGDANVTYSCSYIEVYNEGVKDLLAPTSERGEERNRSVHVHPKHGVTIEGLTPIRIGSPCEAMELVQFGNQMRSVACTTMNQRSSRSHAIFTINVEGVGQYKTSSSMTFVDLAGREDRSASVNEVLHFKEMTFINRSLFHLAMVINQLSKGQCRGGLAPFRNSKLTLLLSPALMGNSRTTFIAACAPLASLYDETLKTLKLAKAVKQVKTEPLINKSKTAMLSDLQKEVEMLKNLAGKETEKDQQLADAQALISALQLQCESFESNKDIAAEAKTARERVAAELGFAAADNLSPGTPYLTNMSADPALQGICNYFVRQDQHLTVGSDRSSSMVLQGVGIRPRMCSLFWDTSAMIVVIKLETDQEGVVPRVIVNGVPLEWGQEQIVRHSDSVVFGYCRSFRLICPEQTSTTDNVDLDADETTNEMMDEKGQQYQAVTPFLHMLSAHLEKDSFSNFVSALHRICPLVDEANVITNEVRPRDGLSFRVTALTDLIHFAQNKPDLAICVFWDPETVDMSSPSAKKMVDTIMAERTKDMMTNTHTIRRASGTRRYSRRISTLAPLSAELGLGDMMHATGSDAFLLYIWPVERFLTRLQRIRVVYEEAAGESDGVTRAQNYLRRNPENDPWHETSMSASRRCEGFFEGGNVEEKKPVKVGIRKSYAAHIRGLSMGDVIAEDDDDESDECDESSSAEESYEMATDSRPEASSADNMEPVSSRVVFSSVVSVVNNEKGRYSPPVPNFKEAAKAIAKIEAAANRFPSKFEEESPTTATLSPSCASQSMLADSNVSVLDANIVALNAMNRDRACADQGMRQIQSQEVTKMQSYPMMSQSTAHHSHNPARSCSLNFDLMPAPIVPPVTSPKESGVKQRNDLYHVHHHHHHYHHHFPQGKSQQQLNSRNLSRTAISGQTCVVNPMMGSHVSPTPSQNQPCEAVGSCGISTAGSSVIMPSPVLGQKSPIVGHGHRHRASSFSPERAIFTSMQSARLGIGSPLVHSQRGTRGVPIMTQVFLCGSNKPVTSSIPSHRSAFPADPVGYRHSTMCDSRESPAPCRRQLSPHSWVPGPLGVTNLKPTSRQTLSASSFQVPMGEGRYPTPLSSRQNLVAI